MFETFHLSNVPRRANRQTVVSITAPWSEKEDIFVKFQTQLRVFPHNIQARMATIKLSKNLIAR